MAAIPLIDAGFSVEGHLPLMTCAPESARILPVPEGIELILPISDADLFATVTVQHEAYGESPPDSSSIDPLKISLAAGGIAVLSRITATGEPVGAGMCSVPSNHTTEIAGIGVRVAFRCRGVAGALTTRLVREAFAAGICVPFLMAAHEAEKRIYARAGFSVVGEILHISHSKP
jgi:ribosomal protein S18 acetylase RimI-like enzyme